MLNSIQVILECKGRKVSNQKAGDEKSTKKYMFKMYCNTLAIMPIV